MWFTVEPEDPVIRPEFRKQSGPILVDKGPRTSRNTTGTMLLWDLFVYVQYVSLIYVSTFVERSCAVSS